MKAPKYVIWTDHKTGHAILDNKIRLDAKNLAEAMSETLSINENDEHLYCTTIYRLIEGTKGREFKPVAVNYEHGGFYPIADSLCYRMHREVIDGVEYFELRYAV